MFVWPELSLKPDWQPHPPSKAVQEWDFTLLRFRSNSTNLVPAEISCIFSWNLYSLSEIFDMLGGKHPPVRLNFILPSTSGRFISFLFLLVPFLPWVVRPEAWLIALFHPTFLGTRNDSQIYCLGYFCSILWKISFPTLRFPRAQQSPNSIDTFSTQGNADLSSAW